ncbi:HAUS augmin-like complex subunit 6 [Danio rerio]|uniref:HAUS augmin-like complex subunit 6 n=1 Tax=Danio rerio TaxID=7955 RepID=HAUS6_DANRE|nr:HAUS augmin-like complex subunit 6 [Danio rerio]A0JMF7.1 RecName: Full=HAUS augmin-like complex subunit 6 [Danio rerio]AAI25862.1 Family with sequence similarity 29, member A [Danio rerio]|eukprot:NP_001073443.1 HAUS augmin-like complex subunit 6 [Danio rerio]
MSKLKKTDGKYLWWCLLCLKFKPDNVSVTKTTKHLNLGMNMFDKPNKEAFYIVIHFLFNKLNPTRAQDVFRNCWLVWDHKSDAEFRKVAFAWLQEIANEEGSAFPKVAASHLLSAFGPKFINLMLHLAKHVMLKTMKTFNTDGMWVPEAAAVPASSEEMELKRFQLVKRQFQRVTVEQDFLIQDYQKRAKVLEKSLRDLDAENAKYDSLLKEHDSITDLKEVILAKVQKLRGLWNEVDRFLSNHQGKRDIVASVINGQVDQYILCGQELNVKMPAALRERMERPSHQSSAVRLYEGGQPVLVRLLALLNEGLHVLREEREKIVGPSVQLQNQDVQEHALLFTRSKENLNLIRWKLVKEDAAEIKVSIGKLEEEWECKWANCLKNTPLTCFLEEDPVLDLVSPMVALSFEPASEASFQASVISQYPCKPHDLLEQPSKEKLDTTVAVVHLEQEVHLKPEIKISSVATEDQDVLVPSDSCFSPEHVTCGTPPCETILSVIETPSPKQPCHTNLHSKPKASVLKTKAQILDLECDNLASQFADAVIMSPGNQRSDVDLGQLLNAISDPFSSRKQLCRTPESLIKDVRSSWRKAVEEGLAEKKQASWNQQDSLSWLKTPMANMNSPCKTLNLESSMSFSTNLDNCTSPPVQQGSTLHSTLSWDSSQMEVLTSQCSSDVIKFSIAQEEPPDLFDVSFNSDSSVENSGEKARDEELCLPSVGLCYLDETPQLTEQLCLGASSDKSVFKDSPVHLSMSKDLSHWTTDHFSLDLDRLESLSSPPRAENLTLPNLVNVNLDEY